jgi:hypothetical protein
MVLSRSKSGNILSLLVDLIKIEYLLEGSIVVDLEFYPY